MDARPRRTGSVFYAGLRSAFTLHRRSVRRGGSAQQVESESPEKPRAANDSPQLRGGSEQKRTDPFDSEDFPATITNSPEVAEIVCQRLVDSGFEIKSAESAETRKEPQDGKG